MKTLIAFVVFLFMTTCSYGQYDWTEGELVLKNGDTLLGQMKLPIISKNLVAINGKEKVKYRKHRKAKKEKFDETQVEKLIFKNSDFETAYFRYIQTSENKKGLFKIITSGNATLYARNVSVSSGSPSYGGGINGGFTYWSYSYSNFNEFYVSRKDEKIASPLITARISRSFKKRAMEYFSDCLELVRGLENRVYVKTDIREVVKFYNSCN